MVKKKFFKLEYDNLLISSNLLGACEQCMNSCAVNYQPIKCPIDSENRKQGKIITGKKNVFLCSNEEKNSKQFRQKLDSLLYTFKDIKVVKEEIESSIRKTEQQKINRLVHNLASINAYNIQTLYDLAQQESLSSNWRDQISYLKKEISNNLTKTAHLFLRLTKNSIQMKSEFSIYRKLDRESNVQLDFNYHPIRKVVLNVLHTFFSDLSDKNVVVTVGDYSGRVSIDYETIQVALYHLIENATKYTIPNSNINIEFHDSNTHTCCKISMKSLFVNKDERTKIFSEGYSGELAKKTLKSGDGIGLWRIKQIMELNGGYIDCKIDDTQEVLNGFPYGNNTFSLYFKK